MKWKGYVLGIISAVSYGLLPVFILPIKHAHFSLDITLFYRFLFSALMIGGYLVYSKEGFSLSRKELLIFSVLGICYAFSSEFLFLGYDYLTAGIASTVLFIYPVIVALIMFFLYKEQLSGLSLVSLLLALSGVIILCLKGNSLEINYSGLGIVLLSAVFYALYIVIVNKSNIKASGFKLSFYTMLFTSGFFMIKAIVAEDSFVISSVSTISDLLIFAFITTVVSSLSLVYAIRYIGSTAAAILGALEPVVAVMISVIWFHEQLSLNLLSGISLILIGVVLNVVADHRKVGSSQSIH